MRELQNEKHQQILVMSLSIMAPYSGELESPLNHEYGLGGKAVFLLGGINAAQ